MSAGSSGSRGDDAYQDGPVSSNTPKLAQSTWNARKQPQGGQSPSLSSGARAAYEIHGDQDPPLQSPCFVHSYLDSGLGSMRSKGSSSYFEQTHDSQSGQGSQSRLANDATLENDSTVRSMMAATSEPDKDGTSSESAATSTMQGQQRQADAPTPPNKERSRRQSVRHQPMYRSLQGAVEPDSEDEGSGSNSDGSSYSSANSGSYTLSEGEDGGDNDENRVRSLTRQLAETAVGVREMSKQLGRARVKSTINSVLIITKARDNHLIKLTRELAIWLMATPRNGRSTGLTVYVDSQLRMSKRFDADGIRRDHPQLFAPGLSASSARSFNGVSEEMSRGNGTGSKSSSSSASQNSQNSHSGGSPHGRHSDDGLLRYWTSDMCSRSPHLFDMVVTLGGDGTVLFCSWLFQRIVPPVMPFALGSLGFLTNFDFSDYAKVMTSALETGVRVNLRMRFTATVYRATLPSDQTMGKRRRRAIRSGKTGEIIMKGIQDCGWDSIETPLPKKHDLRGAHTEGDQAASGREQDRRPADNKRTSRCKRDKEVMCFSTRPVETFEVINDLVVDRGPSPYVSLLEVFGDEHHLTTAQADGLCISTPTGSTAYSLSAGGSLVHPEIPAILISPICPHTLSFRPMLLPDSMELRIAVPYNSRSTAWASFDGRGRVELKQGDHIKVTASKYPFPTVCADNQSTDWFESISRTLKWNERQRQKSFVVVEENREDEASPNGAKRAKKGKEARQETEPVKNAEKESRPPPQRPGASSDTAQMGDNDDDEEEEEDDEDDVDEDEEENEEHYDIDDTSTAATRSNSPDADGRRRHSTTDLNGAPRSHHQHHHHHHSHEHRSAPSSAASSTRNLLGLQPLTSTSTNNRSKRANEERPDSSGNLDSTGHRPDLVSPPQRSLLDSPDRFGFAGPPQPPRAISERHLASADFRLDDSSANEKHKDATKEASLSNGGQQTAFPRSESETVQANALRDSITEMAEREAQISDEHRGNRLYHNLKKRSGSGRVPTRRDLRDGSASSTLQDAQVSNEGGTSRDARRRNRSSSLRPSGTALVVYGQDESDSDSTAEG